MSQRPVVTIKLRLERGADGTGTKWPPGLGGSAAEPERTALIWPSGLPPCGTGKGPKTKEIKIRLDGGDYETRSGQGRSYAGGASSAEDRVTTSGLRQPTSRDRAAPARPG